MSRVMKDSGIDWIGQIPKEWEVCKIKFCIINNYAGVWGEDEKGNRNDVRCYRVADFNYSQFGLSNSNPTKRNIEPKVFSNRRVLFGDILLEKSGGGDKTPVGRAVYVNYKEEAICSNFVHCIRVNRQTKSKFLVYILSSMYNAKLNLLYFNQTTGIQNLNVADYLNNIIPLPPLSEQQSIADYLDTKCAEIDKLIALHEQMIIELKSYKQSVITETVTKGLNPNAIMKDSGIDWIGQIPKEWEVCKIQYIADLKSGYNLTTEQISDTGSYPVFGGNGLRGYYNRYFIEGVFVLIGRQGALCGNINYSYSKFWATEHAVICYPKLNFNVKWFGEILRAMNLNQYSLASAQPGLSVERIKQLPLPLPPLSEQQAIADYLDRKCAQIDELSQIKRQKIDELKEYKKSLIFECVTGKREII